MSQDMCVRASIDCVEETPGRAKMILSMKNYCEKYATQEQMEEIKNMLIKEMETREGCRKDESEKGGWSLFFSMKYCIQKSLK